MNEPIGLRPADLPRLAMILGGHGVFDHWRPKSMMSYRYHDETPVFTATRRMARQAQKAGFAEATYLQWGDRRQITADLSVTSLPGESVLAGTSRTNNYLIEAAGVSVFVGTEACSLEPIRECARYHSVDVAVLPIDGLTIASKRLVMDAATAIEAANILGARALAPIHYSQRPVRGLWTCPSGIDELNRLAKAHPNLAVPHAATGSRASAGRG